jgi:hypothetical protein
MTVRIFFKVIAGYHLGFIIALGKDHPQFFAISCFSLQGKGGTRPVIPVAFTEIDNSLLHDFVNLFFADMTAIHTAQSMLGVIDFGGMPVKSFLHSRLVLDPRYNQGQHGQY